MKNNDELLEQMIKEEYGKAAKEEDAALLKDESISVPSGVKESLFLKISEKIEKLEQDGKIEGSEGEERAEEIDCVENKKELEKAEKKEEKQPDNLYANMSEEDRKALEIGRRVMEEEAKAEREGKVVRKKKRVRMYVGVAAALVLAMAWGVTSMGGPEKIIKMMTQMVGSREIERVDSSDKNLIIENEDEDEAYRKIREEFGIEPIRLMIVLEDMKFVSMKLHEVLQTVELHYEYNGEAVVYLISASYKDSSLGHELADEVVDKYPKDVNGKTILVKEYQVDGEDIERFSASFEEMDLKYFLFGTMKKAEFELLVENLHFLW